MRRISKILGGLILSGTVAAGVGAHGAEKTKSQGIGPAYELIGKVAVMHEGRVKPLDTVAREEVKQVYSRETIKLPDPHEEIEKILDPASWQAKVNTEWPIENWGPVAAFIGWSIDPGFWDDQPFILVDYLPLRREITAGTLRTRLKAIADKSTTPDDEKAALQGLIDDKELASAQLATFARGSKLPIEDRRTIAELAAKLSEEHKWMTPRELDEAQVAVDGQQVPFMDWASELQTQQRKFDLNPKSAARLTPLEKRAVEVAMRFLTYKAYSGERIQNSGVVMIMPRPANRKYLADSAQSINEARSQAKKETPSRQGGVDMPLFKLDQLKAISTYWTNIPREDQHDPTEDATFDERYTQWLRDNSAWVPLKVMLQTSPDDLVKAGYPEGPTRSFLDAYHALEQAETSSPGLVSEAVAARLLAASRELGEAVNPTKYPTVAMVERETHFNAMNPFWRAPFAYAGALALLVISLAFVAVGRKPSSPSLSASTLYGLGLAALAAGIGLEVYGFYLRVSITGWAPVTNMYETVIWVALVAAVLSFVFEMIYRRVYFALAGSAVALLGTITAAHVPLLDPSIKSLQPVLRSNLWLTIHVLTEVSSYAAFGLAWMLGLIGCIYYLAATYRRSPRFWELALPLIPGLLLSLIGGLGMAAYYGLLGSHWSLGDVSAQSSSQTLLGGDILFYALAGMGWWGIIFSLSAILAMGGELLDRASFRYREDEPEPQENPQGVKLDARGRAMQETLSVVKPLSNFIYRSMQVGVLLITAGTMLGGVWADYSWGRFWGWDPKEVWALATLVFYLVPLHGRFAGWIGTFGLVALSVACFLSVIMAWYGVNFVLGVGLHSYGFTEGGSQGAMSVIIACVLSVPFAAGWRRFLGQQRL
jgi:ABC-type transport system involved in cytochrome c biogenesis permease subunit